MTDLPLVFLGGLLGSSHCIGMCGGFAVAIGSSASGWRENLLRQSAYGAGRVFTYASLGAAAGFGGRKLVLSVDLFNVQAVLAIVAGLLLITQGLRATGATSFVMQRLRRTKTDFDVNPAGDRSPANVRPKGFKTPTCLKPGLLGSLLRRRDATASMLAGVLTGFLPCGLVYAMLALALTCSNLITGSLTMIVFGLGTLPLMTALGLGTSLVGLTTRRRMLQMAAWCVVATGALSLGRGAYALSLPRAEGPVQSAPACPLCRAATETSTFAQE